MVNATGEVPASNGRRPKLVVSDMDGTLLRPGAVLSPRTWAAIQLVRDAGVPFIVATGRSAFWLGPVIEAGFDGLAVCDNGATGYDIARDELVFADPIQADVLGSVIDDVAKVLPDTGFLVQRVATDLDGRRADTAFRTIFPNSPVVSFVVDRPEVSAQPALKLVIAHPVLSSERLGIEVRDLVSDRVEVVWSQSEVGLIEVSAHGVNKASGVSRIADLYGVGAADVLAFGDMINDLPMLSWVGRAVVPAGGHPLALALADQVTGPNEEDGVADYLERLFTPAAAS